MRVDFNTNILTSRVFQFPEKGQLAKSHFPGLEQWLKDEVQPTFNQLISLANFFQVPFGYFFLDTLPVKEYPIPHFRSINNQPFQPSAELLETVETLCERQQWAKDILKDLRETKLPFANSCTISKPVEECAEEIRTVLGLPEHWANTLPSWTEALRLLAERAEAAGIFVVINGVVNNNTKRKLNVNEFRGFVLYDDFAPFVFINNNDAVSAKIFTLVHEIVHSRVLKRKNEKKRSSEPRASYQLVYEYFI